MNVKFRLAKKADINQIMDIISQAQADLKKQSIDQWQNNYPNKQTILKDIKNNNCYILLKKDIIIATAALIFEEEITYNNIHNGKWLNNNNYSTIHRIAVSDKYKSTGIATILLRQLEQLSLKNKVSSIRVDTHQDNVAMNKFLIKQNFLRCGIIYLENKQERVAYEKLIGR